MLAGVVLAGLEVSALAVGGAVSIVPGCGAAGAGAGVGLAAIGVAKVPAENVGAAVA